MTENNKHNLLYFESDSMKGLYNTMQTWQEENNKRLLSTNIQQDNGSFCCIALTNPTEVIICDPGWELGGGKARVDKYGYLATTESIAEL